MIDNKANWENLEVINDYPYGFASLSCYKFDKNDNIQFLLFGGIQRDYKTCSSSSYFLTESDLEEHIGKLNESDYFIDNQIIYVRD